MPKQEIDGDGLFNLALAIVGLVLKTGGISVSELAQHFGVSEKVIHKAVHAITNSEDLTSPAIPFLPSLRSLRGGNRRLLRWWSKPRAGPNIEPLSADVARNRAGISGKS